MGLASMSRSGSVDMNLGVGESFDAWLEKRSSCQFPVWYVGVTDDAIAKEWFMRVKHEIFWYASCRFRDSRRPPAQGGCSPGPGRSRPLRREEDVPWSA